MSSRSHPIVACALVVALLPGCALIKTRGPPSNYSPQLSSPSCTTDRVPPRIDAVLGGLSGVGILGYAIAGPEAFKDTAHPQDNYQSGIIAFSVATVLFAGSSVYGFVNTSRCDTAEAVWKEFDVKRTQEAQEAQARAEVARQEAQRQAAEREAENERRKQKEEQEREQPFIDNRAAPLQHANIRVVNLYSASIFRIDVILPDSHEDFRPIDEERVAGFDSRSFKDALTWRTGQRVQINVAAQSLGEWRNVGRWYEDEPRPGKTLVIEYGWDPATAEFGVGTSWK